MSAANVDNLGDNKS